MTISFDGKTICSTGKMSKYQSPLHIVSAHLAEQEITLASLKVDDKSNEIPAVRDLIGLLEVEGCMIVADAMHCQKETASLVIEKKAKNQFKISLVQNYAWLSSGLPEVDPGVAFL